jgi:5-methylcytosine-specific restriction endonuclease McrA
MSFSGYNKKNPYYKILPKENVFYYFKRLIRSIVAMYPYAKEHGFRYYFDTEFRRRISFKRNSYRKKLLRRKREGSFSRSKIKVRLKLKLVERDQSDCNICKQPFDMKNLTIDHVLPLFQGGNSEIDNLQLLCEPCHQVKTKQEHKDWYAI